jgi:hypothetical protein
VIGSCVVQFVKLLDGSPLPSTRLEHALPRVEGSLQDRQPDEQRRLSLIATPSADTRRAVRLRPAFRRGFVETLAICTFYLVFKEPERCPLGHFPIASDPVSGEPSNVTTTLSVRQPPLAPPCRESEEGRKARGTAEVRIPFWPAHRQKNCSPKNGSNWGRRFHTAGHAQTVTAILRARPRPVNLNRWCGAESSPASAPSSDG